MSQRGSGADALVSESFGMKRSPAARAPITIGTSQASDAPKHSKKRAAAPNPREPARRARPQPRRASLPYKRQNTACAAAPVIDPTAAAAANLMPASSARKNAIGPDVSGSPTSQPLTPGPQRRPARLTAPISAGVNTSLSARPSTVGASRGESRPSADDAECEAASLIVQGDAVFLDLLDAEPAVEHLALGLPPSIDEDHALRRHVRVDQRLELERGALARGRPRGRRRAHRRTR